MLFTEADAEVDADADADARQFTNVGWRGKDGWRGTGTWRKIDRRSKTEICRRDAERYLSVDIQRDCYNRKETQIVKIAKKLIREKRRYAASEQSYIKHIYNLRGIDNIILKTNLLLEGQASFCEKKPAFHIHTTFEHRVGSGCLAVPEVASC